MEGCKGGEGGEHPPPRLAFDGTLHEDEAEAGGEAPVQATGLDLEDGGVGAPAMEAEDGRQVGRCRFGVVEGGGEGGVGHGEGAHGCGFLVLLACCLVLGAPFSF